MPWVWPEHLPLRWMQEEHPKEGVGPCPDHSRARDLGVMSRPFGLVPSGRAGAVGRKKQGQRDENPGEEGGLRGSWFD